MEKGNLAGLADVDGVDLASMTGVVEKTRTVTTVLGDAGGQVAETFKAKVLDKATDAVIEEAQTRARRSADESGDGSVTGDQTE